MNQAEKDLLAVFDYRAKALREQERTIKGFAAYGCDVAAIRGFSQ